MCISRYRRTFTFLSVCITAQCHQMNKLMSCNLTCAVALHARGRVDSVSKQTVPRHGGADDARHHRPCTGIAHQTSSRRTSTRRTSTRRTSSHWTTTHTSYIGHNTSYFFTHIRRLHAHRTTSTHIVHRTSFKHTDKRRG